MNRVDTRASRIETLKKTQESRKQDSLERVYKAIERLKKIGAKINFHTVAKEANLSVSYLYKYPELKQHVAELRSKQSSMPVSPIAKSGSSSHVKVVNRFKERIRQLDEQNQELRRKNEALAGQVYRVHYLKEQVERQQQTIEDLQTRLKEAHAQLAASKVTPINQAKILQESLPISEVPKSSIPNNIQTELDKLGIKLNSTLTRKIKATDEKRVLNALAALEKAMGSGNVKNAIGFLVQAITEGWTKEDSPPQLPQRQPEIYTASSEPEEEVIPPDQLTDQLKQLFGGLDE
jgi:DNA repair exonuclease SbcCD ATPase subunit